jgi:hypothetical protein
VLVDQNALEAGYREMAADRLPRGTDRRALAEYILTVMEGAVMQARSYRDIGYFDRNVAMLRQHIDMLAARTRGANSFV